MPCYRCGTRQVDPDRGESPWRRGVRANRQVLICPECQLSADWAGDLDRCQRCGSIQLVRRLGEVECRECGAVGAEPAGSGHGDIRPSGPALTGDAVRQGGAVLEDAAALQDDAALSDLAAEVERALAKVLGPSRQRPPYALS